MLKIKLNDFIDSRNLGNEFNQRQAPYKLEFNRARYHVLREIYQKFGRVYFVKRISLYLKSRTRPVRKHTSKIHSQHNSDRPPKLQEMVDRHQFQGTI